MPARLVAWIDRWRWALARGSCGAPLIRICRDLICVLQCLPLGRENGVAIVCHARPIQPSDSINNFLRRLSITLSVTTRGFPSFPSKPTLLFFRRQYCRWYGSLALRGTWMIGSLPSVLRLGTKWRLRGWMKEEEKLLLPSLPPLLRSSSLGPFTNDVG